MLSPDFSSLRPQDYGLLTDLYQFTMAACYVGEGLESQPAAFELFVRRLPTDYGYLIAMGLTQAVDYLQQLSFAPEALRALRETGIFADAPERFWELLARCRFEGGCVGGAGRNRHFRQPAPVAGGSPPLASPTGGNLLAVHL